MLVPPESLSAVLVMVSSKSVSICNRSHARRVWRCLCLMSSFEVKHTIWSQKKLETTLSYGENLVSLFHVGLDRYRVVTDGRMDGRT